MSLATEEGRRDSFYVCEINVDGDDGEEDGDGDDASERDLAAQLKHTQLDLADFKRMARRDPENLFAMCSASVSGPSTLMPRTRKNETTPPLDRITTRNSKPSRLSTNV